MDAILKVQGIDKKFDTVHALKGVSISFYPGEIHGLIGENGSGKSTLSSIISGIYPATEGTMVLEGKDYKPVSILDGENHGGQNDRPGNGQVIFTLSFTESVFVWLNLRNSLRIEKGKICFIIDEDETRCKTVELRRA